jgi:hypothetical protein
MEWKATGSIENRDLQSIPVSARRLSVSAPPKQTVPSENLEASSGLREDKQQVLEFPPGCTSRVVGPQAKKVFSVVIFPFSLRAAPRRGSTLTPAHRATPNSAISNVRCLRLFEVELKTRRRVFAFTPAFYWRWNSFSFFPRADPAIFESLPSKHLRR